MFYVLAIGTLSFAADDHVLLYIDGVSRGWTYDAYPSTHTEPVTSACSITFQLFNYVTGAGGFMASTSSGLMTDSSWKCSSVTEPGWTLCEFDDAHWSNAVVVGSNHNPPWYSFNGIHSSAKWISLSVDAGTAYCRKRLCRTTF